MKTFNVEMTFTCYKNFEIEAASEEAARDAAREITKFWFDPVDVDHWSESEIEVPELSQPDTYGKPTGAHSKHSKQPVHGAA